MPKIILGNIHSDDRGSLLYNNDFDATSVKRVYFIENRDLDFKRGWQGHKIEQRWFSAVAGSFEITLIKIDDWQMPIQLSSRIKYILGAQHFTILHVPSGYITSIQALSDSSRLMAMSDYLLNEIEDNFRFDINYFSIRSK